MTANSPKFQRFLARKVAVQRNPLKYRGFLAGIPLDTRRRFGHNIPFEESLERLYA